MFKSDKERAKEILFWRKVDQAKMETACNRVIDVLRKELKLEPHECFYVVQVLYQEFPKETLIPERVEE